MLDAIKDFFSEISIVDIFYLIITILSLIKCSKKGFVIKIKAGNKVRTETIANNIAIPVNTPK